MFAWKENRMSETRNIALPETDFYYKMVKDYVEQTPDEDYSHASQQAFEAFKDMKYGIRIHWGLYSMWSLPGESWPFLKMDYKRRQEYVDLSQKFNPQGFSADAWMGLFESVGMKCMAFTTKHHEGFSLFDTKTRVKRRVQWDEEGGPVIEDCDCAYSVMESPYGRDIVREICDAARKHNIRIDLYFSNPDWYDADFRPYGYHPLTVPGSEHMITQQELDDIPRFYGPTPPVMAPALTEEEKQRMVARHRQQLQEILTNYGKIDMVCLDNWFGPDVWPEFKETIKMARKLQPDCMFRARGIGNYGDYYTPEGFFPGAKANTDMPWMVIYPLGKSFSYDPDGSFYKGGRWIIHNLVDIVAKGGNFMVGIGPDPNGQWHPNAIRDLEEAGRWLKVNGEAIYATRPRPGTLYKESDTLFFTRTKDGQTSYAISTQWPGQSLQIKTLQPKDGSEITMLGHDKPLLWHHDENGLVIELPEWLQQESARPCDFAYAFKIQAVPD